MYMYYMYWRCVRCMGRGIITSMRRMSTTQKSFTTVITMMEVIITTACKME